MSFFNYIKSIYHKTTINTMFTSEILKQTPKCTNKTRPDITASMQHSGESSSHCNKIRKRNV